MQKLTRHRVFEQHAFSSLVFSGSDRLGISVQIRCRHLLLDVVCSRNDLAKHLARHVPSNRPLGHFAKVYRIAPDGKIGLSMIEYPPSKLKDRAEGNMRCPYAETGLRWRIRSLSLKTRGISALPRQQV